MKFVDIDRAALHLPFRLEGRSRDLRLVMRHQAAARWHMPYAGEVVLDVVLDGRTLVTHRIVDPSLRDDDMTIPSALATPGDHVLTLRLGEDSTTAWWLHCAWIDVP
jgi:hypothetical protein